VIRLSAGLEVASGLVVFDLTHARAGPFSAEEIKAFRARGLVE
jgi:hypothetical protein